MHNVSSYNVPPSRGLLCLLLCIYSPEDDQGLQLIEFAILILYQSPFALGKQRPPSHDQSTKYDVEIN